MSLHQSESMFGKSKTGAGTPPSPAVSRANSDRRDGGVPDQGLTRRTFLRVLGLGSLTWLGTVLLRRSCAGRGACGGCASFGNCGLPWKEARR